MHKAPHMRRFFSLLVVLVLTTPLAAAEIQQTTDAQTGWRIYTARAGQTTIRVIPAAGFNVYSIEHAGRQLLKTPQSLADVSSFHYGTPLLYPDHEWNQATAEIQQAVIEAELAFAPGTPYFERFPYPHTLRVAVTITDGNVSWTYTVDNRDGKSPLPFGFALHPWFLYQGSRKNTFLTIPATHWMEAEELLPTGKLVDLEGTKFDARQPKSLDGFVIDDVYYGMSADQPTTIDFRDAGVKISLAADNNFTHLVVYTPQNQDWFCVENQTCSTDAHNLYARGLKDESHLLIAPPGEVRQGTATFHIDDARQHDFAGWEKAIRKFEARDRYQPPAPGGTLFVGSSSIRFWDLPKYFPGRDYINRGFGGSEMIDSLYFADRIVLPYEPKTIVVYAGDNDIAGKQSAATVANDFQRFAAKVHKQLPETRIIYIAIKPSIRRWELYDEMAQANQLIADYAKSDPRITFADIATPMLNDQGTPKPELFIEDGLHLNDAGYKLWTSILQPLLDAKP